MLLLRMYFVNIWLSFCIEYSDLPLAVGTPFLKCYFYPWHPMGAGGAVILYSC